MKILAVIALMAQPALAFGQEYSKQDLAYFQASENIGYVESSLISRQTHSSEDILKLCQKVSFAKGVSEGGTKAGLSADLAVKLNRIEKETAALCQSL